MRFIFILLLLTVSCSTKVKKDEFKKIYTEAKLHHADCLIDEQRYSETGLLLLEESRNIFKVRAGDGKVLALPINQCILSQISQESSFDESQEKDLKWVSCKMGNMTLVTDSLVYIDSEPNFYRLKRKDGQIWVLPRKYCAIFNFRDKDQEKFEPIPVKPFDIMDARPIYNEKDLQRN